jgi:hypothetical protein
LKEFKIRTREEHTYWGDLLKQLGWSRDMADRYICAFQVFGDRAAKLRHLPPGAILLAAASTPVDVRERIIERSQSETVSYKDVKEAVYSAKPQPSREDDEDDDGELLPVFDVRNDQRRCTALQ